MVGDLRNMRLHAPLRTFRFSGQCPLIFGVPVHYSSLDQEWGSNHRWRVFRSLVWTGWVGCWKPCSHRCSPLSAIVHCTMLLLSGQMPVEGCFVLFLTKHVSLAALLYWIGSMVCWEGQCTCNTPILMVAHNFVVSPFLLHFEVSCRHTSAELVFNWVDNRFYILLNQMKSGIIVV